jgi:flavin reductase (DIM6/NTAB) family NADH-FMN oxidoreductase RutF
MAAMPAPLETPLVGEAAFRQALGRFASGVTFVTAAVDGEPHGLVVSAFTSVSLDPPLVAFCPSRASLTWRRMRGAARFGVNVLSERHAAFVERAAPAGADRFAGLAHAPTASGVPELEGAAAFLECAWVDEHPAGDHWIVLGRVLELRADPAAPPLVVAGGRLGGFREAVSPASSR